MRFKFLIVTAAITLVALAAAACGGGDEKTPDYAPDASSTPADSFDFNLLTSVVLLPSDLPPDYQATGGFNPRAAAGNTFGSSFENGAVIINTAVTRYPDVVTRDENLEHARRGLSTLIGPESNLDLAGADAAYIYWTDKPDGPAQAVLVLRDQYWISIVMQARDLTQTSAVTDKDTLKRYTQIMFDRLNTLMTRPEAVTPVAGFPTYPRGEAQTTTTPSPTTAP